MPESRDSSLGGGLGWLAVLFGILFLVLGFAYSRGGQSPDGFDGMLLGGLALVSGCVILSQRNRQARNKKGDSGAPAEAPTTSTIE
jgi:hypothetical protein